jgi:hypothetical protein
MSWGEIYNTSWWGVALDTARTVKARPDFFGSQLNLLTSEQPNLVVNGTFDTDSDWTKGTGWSISGGKANCDGTQVSNSIFYQNIGNQSNKTVEFSFTISDYVSGVLETAFFGASGTIAETISANGNYTFYISVKSGHNGNTGFIAKVGFIGSIDNVSIQVARAELDQIEAKKCLADWIHTTALKDLNN